MYCDVTDVELINGQRRYDSTSIPTRDQVLSMIANISAFMDGRLRAVGFDVPIVDGETSLKLLNSIASWGAASLADMASNPDLSENPRATELWRRYEVSMAKIEKDPMILQESTRDKVTCFDSYSYSNSSSDDSTDPIVEMGQEF